MIKFSIIIPVYNSEQYIEKCIDSVLQQTYKDYEIIIIDDGSTDNTPSIIKKYKDKVKYIKKEHEGQSSTRNAGIDYVSGDYFIFVDSDDVVSPNLLEKVKNAAIGNPEIIRYGIKRISNNKEFNFPSCDFNNLDGINAFDLLINCKYFDSPCVYAISLKYFKDNNFSFEPYVSHEDFGLLPKLIIKSANVSSISDILYNYIVRENSVMTDKSKIEKRANDLLYLGKKLLSEKVDHKEYYNYIATSMIEYLFNLKEKKVRKKYIQELKDIQIEKYLLKNTLKRKIKYILCKINFNLYILTKKKEFKQT